ncbi:MAG TPA: hypothetical protein VIJ22_00985 [Polyangiaceae bacterium]
MITSGPGVGQQIQSAQQQALYDIMNGDLVSSAAGVPSTGGTDGQSPPASLTPEALMVYCQTRLQGIDSQIQAAMAKQQNISIEQSSIGDILGELSNDSALAGNGLMNSPAACQDLEQKLENLITQIQHTDPGCSQLGQLEQLHDAVMATGSGPYTDSLGQQHGYYYQGDPKASPPIGHTPPPNVDHSQDNELTAAEITGFTNTLTTINSSLSSGAEIGMIQIQSNMSDRTTAIQLTTSILQAYDDGLSKIVDKIGQ